jgi:hypothetical protein
MDVEHPKSINFHLGFCIEHNVLILDVSMHDTTIATSSYDLEQLFEQPMWFAFAHSRREFVDVIKQIRTFQSLHYDSEIASVYHALPVHLHNARNAPYSSQRHLF